MVRYWPPKSNWLFQYSRRRSTTAAELTDRQTNASDPMKIVGEHPQYVLISVKHNKPYSMRSIHQADLGLQWHFLLFWASSLRCSISLHDFSLALHWWAYFLTRPIYLFFFRLATKKAKADNEFWTWLQWFSIVLTGALGVAFWKPTLNLIAPNLASPYSCLSYVSIAEMNDSNKQR